MNIAEAIMDLDSEVRSGTLRIFGCWFGRPMDNFHQSKSAEFDGSVLKIVFDKGETIEIWNPSGFVIDGRVLKIPRASKVRWSWHYYGRQKTSENLLFKAYVVKDNDVSFSTNTPWLEQPSINEPAVEIC